MIKVKLISGDFINVVCIYAAVLSGVFLLNFFFVFLKVSCSLLLKYFYGKDHQGRLSQQTNQESLATFTCT